MLPAVVLSDNALDIVAASWSIWFCACTSVWSRSFRSAAIWPEETTLLATTSTDDPFGSLMLNAPTPDLAGSML